MHWNAYLRWLNQIIYRLMNTHCKFRDLRENPRWQINTSGAGVDLPSNARRHR